MESVDYPHPKDWTEKVNFNHLLRDSTVSKNMNRVVFVEDFSSDFDYSKHLTVALSSFSHYSFLREGMLREAFIQNNKEEIQIVPLCLRESFF